MIYSYDRSQQDTLFHTFILVNNSTCFGQTYCPISGFLLLYSQQLVFVILVMLTVCQRDRYSVHIIYTLFHLIVLVVTYISHLRQDYHNSRSVIFQERLLKVLKCYNFLWVQRRHNCSPAASFANCVMTLYLLKVRLQTFFSIPVTQKFQIWSCDTLVAKERYEICNISGRQHGLVKE